jgi:hypothetical protein
MNLFLPFQRARINRDAAFEQAFREGALDRVPGRCAHCGRRILNPSNMARHVRAKHPDASDVVDAPPAVLRDTVFRGASATVSTEDVLGDSVAA